VADEAILNTVHRRKKNPTKIPLLYSIGLYLRVGLNWVKGLTLVSIKF
jgi:hypothetical protein